MKLSIAPCLQSNTRLLGSLYASREVPSIGWGVSSRQTTKQTARSAVTYDDIQEVDLPNSVRPLGMVREDAGQVHGGFGDR
jgi:hypothetical protein